MAMTKILIKIAENIVTILRIQFDYFSLDRKQKKTV